MVTFKVIRLSWRNLCQKYCTSFKKQCENVCMLSTSACRKNKCSFGNSNDNRYIVCMNSFKYVNVIMYVFAVRLFILYTLRTQVYIWTSVSKSLCLYYVCVFSANWNENEIHKSESITETSVLNYHSRTQLARLRFSWSWNFWLRIHERMHQLEYRMYEKHEILWVKVFISTNCLPNVPSKYKHLFVCLNVRILHNSTSLQWNIYVKAHVNFVRRLIYIHYVYFDSFSRCLMYLVLYKNFTWTSLNCVGFVADVRERKACKMEMNSFLAKNEWENGEMHTLIV